MHRNSAILAGLETDLAGAGGLRRRTIARRLRSGATSGGPTRASQPGLGNVRAVRLRLFVRVCRSVDRGAACFCHWCVDPFCLENLPCEFALRVDRDKAAPQILMLGSTASRSHAVASAGFSAEC